MVTEIRPVALPPRGGQQTATPQQVKPPAGAVAMRKSYLNAKGVPESSPFPVPVDADERRTEHVRHTCCGHIEVDGVKQPCDQVKWLLPAEPAQYCPDHGCMLDAEQAKEKPLLPWRAMWQSQQQALRPWAVLAGEAAVGAGVHAADVPWWAAAGNGPLLAAGAYIGTRWYLTKRAIKRGKLEKGQRTGRRVDTIARRSRTAAYMAATFDAWLALAAATDPTTVPGAVCWASLLPTWALSWVPYWRYVDRLKNRPEPEHPAETPATAAEVKPTTDPGALQDATDWAEQVANGAGLPNTVVDVATWRADEGGRRMVIRAQKGALTDERIQQAVPLIAAAFDVKRSAIGWVAEYEGSPRSALLLVQPNSPLNEPVAWQPVDVVDIDDAVAHIGTRIDGSQLVTRLWTPGWGAPSRAIFGTKGSGKTEFLRLLLLAMLKARVMGTNGPVRLIAPFLHDPKLGKDFGAFRRQVCGFSTTSEGLHAIVEAFIREMDRRYDALATEVWRDEKGRLQEGEIAFDPRFHGPILSLVVDEFHINAKDQALLAKVEPMARKMRAAGIEIVTATHMATLGDTGSQAFRDMVAGGEATLFRTTSGLTSALATGGTLVGDPRALPRVPGMNLHASGEEDTMQARMAYVPPAGLYDLLYDDDNRSRIQPVEWLSATLEAFGRDFVEWMRACQARQPGDPAPAVPKAHASASRSSQSTSADDLNAVETLRQILFVLGEPADREAIREHPLWTYGVTTLTNALRKGQDAKPPWVVRHGFRPVLFELSAVERERIEAERAEESEAA